MKTNMFKIISVTSSVLWKEYAPHFKVLAAVKRDEHGKIDENVLADAHAVFNAIIRKMNAEKDMPFTVHREECMTNTARQSLLSNIFFVKCGTRQVTENMISVAHNLFRTPISTMPKEVADLNPDVAERRIELLQKMVMKRLTSRGIDIIEKDGTKKHYGFIVATPSQQKNGGMYMGLDKVMSMEPVQKALNFGWLFNEFNHG